MVGKPVPGQYRVVHSVIGSQASIGPFVKEQIISDAHFIGEFGDYTVARRRWLELGAIEPVYEPEPVDLLASKAEELAERRRQLEEEEAKLQQLLSAQESPDAPASDPPADPSADPADTSKKPK